LCGRLDNLPLALELAAARVRVLTPAQILERISQRLDLFRAGRDTDPRQQTLRATIAWSYDLLTTAEQAPVAPMAVFGGRAALEHLQDRAPLHYLQLAGALGWFWLTRAHFTEGSRRLEAAPTANVDGPLTARALTYLGAIDATRGRFAAALCRLERAVALW